MNCRDKLILCGLFLSKFDKEGLAYLGFESFTEAFNSLGYGLGARPASIKNYRDELDPLFPNPRRGWHRRPLRDHCKRMFDEFGDIGIDSLGTFVRAFIEPATELEASRELRRILSHDSHGSQSGFAKRLITGRAAEHYFRMNAGSIDEFKHYQVTDTTTWGCGFDYKLNGPSGSSFLAVEVKGIKEKSGSIQMTELEYDVAKALKNNYILVIVRNFVKEPFHTVIKDPARGSLNLARNERHEVRVTWCAAIS